METPESRRAPGAVRAEETDYRAIFDAMSDAILVHDVETGQILDVNRKMCEMFGHSREEARRLQVTDLCGWEPRCSSETFQQMIAKTEGGADLTFEWQAMAADGRRFWTEVSLRRAVLDGCERVLAVIRDVSRRRQAEEALKESEARFRLLTEDSLAGVYIIQDDRLVYCNPTMAQIFGYGIEEILSPQVKPRDLVHPEDLPLVRENLRKRLEGEQKSVHYTFRGRRRDGAVIFCEVLGAATEYQGRPAVIGTLLDVSERLQAEEALKQSEARYRSLFQNNHAVMLLIDPGTGSIVDANPAACLFYGYRQEQLAAMKITDLNILPPGEVFQAMARAQSSGQGHFLFRHRLAGGQAREVEVFSGPIRVHGRELLYSIIHDVTARRRAEEALRETSNTLQALIQACPLAVVALDHHFNVTAWNPAAAKIFGWTEEEVLERLLPIIPADQWQEAAARIERELQGGSQTAVELHRLKKDGSLIDVQLWTATLRNAGGEVIGVLGIFADISERKAAETALQASQANYRTIFNAVNDAIALVDLETGNFLEVNRTWCEMTGFTAEEARGLNVAALCVDVPGFSAAAAMEMISKSVLEGPQLFQWLARTKDGRHHWVEVNLARTLLNGQYRLLTVVRDVSERRRAEEAVRASEAKYRNLVEQIPAVTYIAALDNVTSHIYISPQIEAVLGFSQEEWLADPEFFKNRLHPDDRDRVLSELILSYSQGGPFAGEYRMVAKSGRVVWIRDESRAVYDARGLPLFMQGVALDITGQKETEEALRESEARFRGVFEGAGVGITLLDLERRVLKANPAGLEIYGYTEDEMRSLTAAEVTHPDDWAADQALFTELVAGKRNYYQVEKRYRHRQGHWVWVRLSVTLVRDASGAPQFAISMAEDITGRRRMEEALKKVSRALRAITECHQAMLRASLETELLNEVCRIIVEVGGYRTAWVGYAEPDEAKTVHPVAQNGFDAGYVRKIKVTWSEESELGRGPIGTAIRTSQPAIVRDTVTDPKFAPWRGQALERGYTSVLALPLKDSGTFGALAIYAGEPDAFDDQEINLLVGLANDLAYGITALRANAERRRTEEALRESEEKYHGLMDYSSDAIMLADLDGNLTEANLRAQELLGYNKDELLKMHYTQLFPPEDLGGLTEVFEGRKKEGLGKIREARVMRKDGGEVHVDITGTRIEYAGKKLIQGILRDITARRKAEEALRESEQKLRSLASQLLTIQERERRRVSRELHDELGQALTVLKIRLVAIESKLQKNQQGLKADCEQLLNYIDGVIENVRRLSWDLSPSILEDLGLSSSLAHLLDETCRNHSLTCSFSMDQMDNLFSPETVINIYRIFQESLTNIVKHARATQISVAIHQQDDRVTFMIKDDGRGFDPETVMARDLPKRGLGLTAMNERALMARGSLTVWSQKGQGTRITFHIPMDK